ncbi:hypothetical protein LRY60_05560 [Candidatus Woesebacteria bacterium]|nr:hypothetical protein [Candidatus Woesebacteria bacterium]MCD8545776.1 hypothetical protein [Candidatus Woesebacteria bacterium]
MQNVIVYAPSSATRKLYHQTLSKRDCDVYKAKDMAEVLVLIATFEIDSVVIVDEGRQQHEQNLIIDLLLQKYDHKRIVLVSPLEREIVGVERFGSTRDFFDYIL